MHKSSSHHHISPLSPRPLASFNASSLALSGPLPNHRRSINNYHQQQQQQQQYILRNKLEEIISNNQPSSEAMKQLNIMKHQASSTNAVGLRDPYIDAVVVKNRINNKRGPRLKPDTHQNIQKRSQINFENHNDIQEATITNHMNVNVKDIQINKQKPRHHLGFNNQMTPKGSTSLLTGYALVCLNYIIIALIHNSSGPPTGELVGRHNLNIKQPNRQQHHNLGSNNLGLGASSGGGGGGGNSFFQMVECHQILTPKSSSLLYIRDSPIVLSGTIDPNPSPQYHRLFWSYPFNQRSSPPTASRQSGFGITYDNYGQSNFGSPPAVLTNNNNNQIRAPIIVSSRAPPALIINSNSNSNINSENNNQHQQQQQNSLARSPLAPLLTTTIANGLLDYYRATTTGSSSIPYSGAGAAAGGGQFHININRIRNRNPMVLSPLTPSGRQQLYLGDQHQFGQLPPSPVISYSDNLLANNINNSDRNSNNNLQLINGSKRIKVEAMVIRKGIGATGEQPINVIRFTNGSFILKNNNQLENARQQQIFANQSLNALNARSNPEENGPEKEEEEADEGNGGNSTATPDNAEFQNDQPAPPPGRNNQNNRNQNGNNGDDSEDSSDDANNQQQQQDGGETNEDDNRQHQQNRNNLNQNQNLNRQQLSDNQLILDLPEFAIAGDSIELSCNHNLQLNRLYSVKWFKDGIEFYRFIPRNGPARAKFYLPLQGIRGDLARSDAERVYLRNVTYSSSGVYRCEVVAEGPNFETMNGEKQMNVYVLSESGPIISVEPANLNQIQSLMTQDEHRQQLSNQQQQQQLNHHHGYYGNQFSSLLQPARISAVPILQQNPLEPFGSLDNNNNNNNNNNNGSNNMRARLENEILGPLVRCNSARSLPASLLRFYINNRLVSTSRVVQNVTLKHADGLESSQAAFRLVLEDFSINSHSNNANKIINSIRPAPLNTGNMVGSRRGRRLVRSLVRRPLALNDMVRFDDDNNNDDDADPDGLVGTSKKPSPTSSITTYNKTIVRQDPSFSLLVNEGTSIDNRANNTGDSVGAGQLISAKRGRESIARSNGIASRSLGATINGSSDEQSYSKVKVKFAEQRQHQRQVEAPTRTTSSSSSSNGVNSDEQQQQQQQTHYYSNYVRIKCASLVVAVGYEMTSELVIPLSILVPPSSSLQNHTTTAAAAASTRLINREQLDQLLLLNHRHQLNNQMNNPNLNPNPNMNPNPSTNQQQQQENHQQDRIALASAPQMGPVDFAGIDSANGTSTNNKVASSSVMAPIATIAAPPVTSKNISPLAQQQQQQQQQLMLSNNKQQQQRLAQFRHYSHPGPRNGSPTTSQSSGINSSNSSANGTVNQLLMDYHYLCLLFIHLILFLFS